MGELAYVKTRNGQLLYLVGEEDLIMETKIWRKKPKNLLES